MRKPDFTAAVGHGEPASRRLGGRVLPLRDPRWMLVALAVTIPASAQTESGGSSASSSGGGAYSAPATGAATSPTGAAGGPNAGPAPTAGLGGRGVPARSPTAGTYSDTAASRALDTGGLAYYPGFSGGCATPGSGIGGGFTQTTLLQPITELAGPARSQGRFVKLSVAGSETYTDNLDQEKNGDSEYITQIAPRLDACQSTGRIRGQLTYQLEGVAYAKNTSDSDIYNEVNANTTIDVIQGHLFLDANTRYGQSVVDPSLGFSRSNSLSPGNKTNTWNFNVSPYVLQSLGPIGNARLRYRYGETRYADPDVPDSRTNAAYLNISSPSRRQTLTWNANATTQEVTRDAGNADRFFARRGMDNPFAERARNNQDDRTTYFDQASLQLGLRATESLKLIGIGGVEDDYQSDGTNDRLSSPYWSAGFNWASGTNTLEARYGHRYYGATYDLRAAHRGRTFNASLEYREQTTSQSRSALNGGSNFNDDRFGPVNSEFDRGGVYVEKRWSASVGANTAYTETTLTGYQQTREYQTSNFDDERNHGASIQTRYQIQPRTALTPRFDWQHSDGNDNNNNNDSNSDSGYDTYSAGLLAEHALAPDLRIGLAYVRSWRNGSSDYTENRVTLSFFKGF